MKKLNHNIYITLLIKQKREGLIHCYGTNALYDLPYALIRGRYNAAGLISFSLKNSIAFNTAST